MTRAGQRLASVFKGGEARARLDAAAGPVDDRPEEGRRLGPITSEDAVAATGRVVRFRRTATVVRVHSVVDVDLVVLAPSSVPRPLSLQLEVSLDQMPWLQRGSTVGVTLSRLDRTRATIDWARTPHP